MFNDFGVTEKDLFEVWSLYNKGLNANEKANVLLQILSTSFFKEILYFASIGLNEYNKTYMETIEEGVENGTLNNGPVQ